jgi:hypothetical protein
MVQVNQSDTRARQVKRIVAFAIVIAIVSAIILAALIIWRQTEAMQRWTPLVLTIEFGLVVILLWSIASSWRQERKRNRSMDRLRTSDLAVTACPDYWTTSSASNGDVICTNVFKSPSDPKVTYTIQGTSRSPGARNINLSSYDGHTVKEVCDLAKTQVAAPWSAVHPMCAN